MKFYVCKHCGNIVTYVHDSGVPVVCCGEKMQELIPGSVDAAGEKHVPVVERDGNLVNVKVGSIPHPMTEEHHIAWVAIETKTGIQRKALKVPGEPAAQFALIDGDEVLNAYAYCNLHGLWKS